MVNRPKNKGTAAETAFVSWLRANGWPHAERRTQKGALDRGDVTGTPGLVFEVKDCKSWDLAGWLRETEFERMNDSANYGILIMKPPRVGLSTPGRWAAAMYYRDLYHLLSQTPEMPHWGASKVITRSGTEIESLRVGFYRHSPGQLTVMRPNGVHDQERFYTVSTVADLLLRVRLAGFGTSPLPIPLTDEDPAL